MKEIKIKENSIVLFAFALTPMAFGWWDITLILLVAACVLFVIMNFKEIIH